MAVNDNLLQAVEHATYGDIRWARALEDEIARRGATTQEHYVCALLRELNMPDFEVTTMAPPNHVRGIKTDHLFALMRATPEQRARAFVEAIQEDERAEAQRRVLFARPKAYPY